MPRLSVRGRTLECASAVPAQPTKRPTCPGALLGPRCCFCCAAVVVVRRRARASSFLHQEQRPRPSALRGPIPQPHTNSENHVRFSPAFVSSSVSVFSFCFLRNNKPEGVLQTHHVRLDAASPKSARFLISSRSFKFVFTKNRGSVDLKKPCVLGFLYFFSFFVRLLCSTQATLCAVV